MNLIKLFDTQRVLDARIAKEHPRVEGEDRLAKKILALQVELGECANEWRGFKFWSNDQEPRISRFAPGVAESYNYNPLLEEYVDCLHFILSIGLEHKFHTIEFDYLHEGNFAIYTEKNTLEQFGHIFLAISEFAMNEELETYEEVFLYFIGLGNYLGFTWDQVEQAYHDKNKINHERQDTGY